MFGIVFGDIPFARNLDNEKKKIAIFHANDAHNFPRKYLSDYLCWQLMKKNRWHNEQIF